MKPKKGTPIKLIGVHLHFCFLYKIEPLSRWNSIFLFLPFPIPKFLHNKQKRTEKFLRFSVLILWSSKIISQTFLNSLISIILLHKNNDHRQKKWYYSTQNGFLHASASSFASLHSLVSSRWRRFSFGRSARFAVAIHEFRLSIVIITFQKQIRSKTQKSAS